MTKDQEKWAKLRLAKAQLLAQLNKLFLRAAQRELTEEEKREKAAANEAIKKLDQQIEGERDPAIPASSKMKKRRIN